MTAVKKLPKRNKHVPQRTCVACRQKRDKRDLVRIVNTPEEGVVVDASGKRNGRGAYLCNSPKCWHNAVERQVLDKSLRTELTAQEKQLILAAAPMSESVGS